MGKDKALQLVQEGNLSKAISHSLRILRRKKAKARYRELVLLKFQLSLLNKEYNIGVLEFDRYMIHASKIANSFIQLIASTG